MNHQPDPRERLETGEAVFLDCFRRSLYIRADDPRIEGAHLHACYEIYVNVTGDVSFLHGQTVYRIRPGDAILSRPGEFHHCIYHSSGDHDHYCVWFTLPENCAATRRLEREGISGLIRLGSEDTAALFEALEGLCRHRENEELEKIACFYRLLSLLLRGEASHALRATSNAGALDGVLDYIHTHYRELYTVEQIAEAAHVSVPTLNRWFRERLQLSPYRYLTAKKLAAAELLLRNGESVTAACLASGFTDCSRFIALFKKNYGKTPLQYQKQGG